MESEEIIEKDIDYGRSKNINPAFISGIAKIDDSAIILLNIEALIRQPDAVRALIEETDSEVEENNDKEETVPIISNTQRKVGFSATG